MSIDKEREAFEAWYEADSMPSEADWFRRDPEDANEYLHGDTASCWRAWQASAAVDRSSLEAVPDGWQLVPVEPTPEMLASVVTSTDEFLLGKEAEKQYRDDWSAMLSAAPAQPAQKEPDWKDMYEKEKRRSAMWIAKYEKDIGPLDYVVPVAPKEPEQPKCWCRTCRPITLNDMRMVVCPNCGNKRCPKANDHRNACTNSNEPGQPGSAYPAPADEAAPEQQSGEEGDVRLLDGR